MKRMQDSRLRQSSSHGKSLFLQNVRDRRLLVENAVRVYRLHAAVLAESVLANAQAAMDVEAAMQNGVYKCVRPLL